MRPSVPFNRGRRQRNSLRGALLRGEALEVPGLLRRTSSRGWGPWTDAVLVLPAVGERWAQWHVDDPVAVGVSIIRGPVDERFVDVEHIGTRPVRFRSEAFWGMESEIVVVTDERSTTELAFPAPVTAPVVDRLQGHLLGDGHPTG